MSHRALQLRTTYIICFGAACGSNEFTLGGKTGTRDHRWLTAGNALILPTLLAGSVIHPRHGEMVMA
jgi:hypothetical protein